MTSTIRPTYGSDSPAEDALGPMPPGALSTGATGYAGIDLSAAQKVVGRNVARGRWLDEMRSPDGMSPGLSSRTHARAFRFAEALRRAGYEVTVGPFGPRGGRRFFLTGYGGPRAGTIYRLQGDRACSTVHDSTACTCFEGLGDHQLRLLTSLHRQVRSVHGYRYGTDHLAHLVRDHDESQLRAAVELYVAADGSALGGPDLEGYLALQTSHTLEVLQYAVGLFSDDGGAVNGGRPLEAFIDAVETALR